MTQTITPEDITQKLAAKRSAALFSVFAALVITALKILTGVLTGSLAMLSEGAHSSIDLVAATITFFSVRVSDRPADDSHNYGHGKVESLAAFFDWFTRLEAEYEELVVDLGDVSAAYSQRIIDICGKALKRLELETCERVVPRTMSQTLADPTLKCQVPLQVSLTVQSFVNCGSLRCTRHGGTKTSSLPLHIQTAGWSSFDNCISALADRLCKSGNRRTRIGTPPRVSMTPDPTVGDMEFLPKFEEKGRVRIVN